jgi:trehalose-6-phosphate synthase
VLSQSAYRQLSDEITTLVGNRSETQNLSEDLGSINGKYGTVQYMPIHFLSRALKWEDGYALMAVAGENQILRV